MERFDVQPLYRALVENAQDILGVLTPAGVVVTVSPAVRRVLGLAPERLQGRHWIDQIHPDDRASARRWLAACQDEDAHRTVTLRAGRPGQWRTLALAGIRVQEEAHLARVVFSARDATEEAAALALLEEREARFRSAFHDAPIGKALLDKQGRILDANRALAALLDRWSSELEGVHYADLFAGAEGMDALQQAWAQRHADAPRRELALRLERRGRPAHLQLTLASVGSDGEADALLQVLDLSSRVEAEQALERNLVQLRDSHAQLGELAWMASHDLKEPLRGLVGSLQLILRRHGDALADSERQTAEQAVAQAKALRGKLDALEARVGQMREDAAQQSLDPAAIAREWAAGRAAALASGGLELGELPSLRTDAGLGEALPMLLDALLAALEREGLAPRLHLEGGWSQGRWQLRLSAPPLAAGPSLLEAGGALFPARSRLAEQGAELRAEALGDALKLHIALQPR